MFTGIVTSLGSIVALEPHRLVVDAPGVTDEPLGASVAIDGCCLTVVALEPAPVDRPRYPDAPSEPTGRLSFDILPETISHTRLEALRVGAAVNVEPALRAGQPLGGHMVQGHVDVVGRVRSSVVEPDGRWQDVELDVPDAVLDYCVERGSITVNGVSLTVMGLDEAGVRLQLIPETQHRTNLGSLRTGDPVNLEADVIARYVARLVARNR